jgi:hypothetical protein
VLKLHILDMHTNIPLSEIFLFIFMNVFESMIVPVSEFIVNDVRVSGSHLMLSILAYKTSYRLYVCYDSVLIVLSNIPHLLPSEWRSMANLSP